MKRRLFLVFGVAALCLTATPAMADLFQFSISNTMVSWNGTSLVYTTDSLAGSVGIVTRHVPFQTAVLFMPAWGGSFKMNMTLTSTGYQTASALGDFTFTDLDSDTLTAQLAGNWKRDGASNSFSGVLSNVRFTGIGGGIDDTTFNGWTGTPLPPSMVFGSAMPWTGAIVELTGQTPWFIGSSAFSTDSGTVGVTVSAVPVPAGVLLGFLGLAAAGLGLRRLA